MEKDIDELDDGEGSPMLLYSSYEFSKKNEGFEIKDDSLRRGER